MANYRLNLNGNRSFVCPKKVASCSVCGVPMSYDLAIIGETSDKILYALNSTEDGYIDILELVFRKIPRFSAGSLEELSKKLLRFCWMYKLYRECFPIISCFLTKNLLSKNLQASKQYLYYGLFTVWNVQKVFWETLTKNVFEKTYEKFNNIKTLQRSYFEYY